MHRTVPVAALVAALAALAPARAAAHEGDRALGTVASVTAERIVVKARDGHEVAFKLTPQTKITRGKEAARPGDVRPGERAVVHGR
ncbi:MAG TPA: hypothetical protein VFM93_14020, partial [Candidatus Limnocylindria bacterium]|nr:hypothetical protein [Candidatus Limnocylindria bacterium]